MTTIYYERIPESEWERQWAMRVPDGQWFCRKWMRSMKAYDHPWKPCDAPANPEEMHQKQRVVRLPRERFT